MTIIDETSLCVNNVSIITGVCVSIKASLIFCTGSFSIKNSITLLCLQDFELIRTFVFVQITCIAHSCTKISGQNGQEWLEIMVITKHVQYLSMLIVHT